MFRHPKPVIKSSEYKLLIRRFEIFSICRNLQNSEWFSISFCDKRQSYLVLPMMKELPAVFIVPVEQRCCTGKAMRAAWWGSEVRNLNEINKYLSSTYSVLGIETATQVAVVGPRSSKKSTHPWGGPGSSEHQLQQSFMQWIFMDVFFVPGSVLALQGCYQTAERCTTRGRGLWPMSVPF